jgi:BirA family transcriptional regulator, biotin operon repressor / biotin---[acetyl-CoA-carboxylase] ligase
VQQLIWTVKIRRKKIKRAKKRIFAELNLRSRKIKIKLMLKNNTLFIGKVAIHLPEVDSTNAYLWEWVAKNSPIEGTVVWADAQTAGRGQVGSSWSSEIKKNLTASFLLLPKWLTAREQFGLSQAVALAICDTLLWAGVSDADLRIKWSNDIFVGGKKIAGVLIENALRGQYLAHSIVGIGLNVNQETFAPELSGATSLKNILKKDTDLTQLLSQLSTFLEYRYLYLKNKGRDEINNQYVARLYQIGQIANYQIAATQEIVSATLQGVSTEGKLALFYAEKVHFFDIKEIKFL